MKNPFEQVGPPETISRRVPEAELRIEFARSSGPGGQKVNKTSSKAVVHWNVDASSSFSDEEKSLLKQRLANRLNKAGEIVLDSDRHRSQHQNKEEVIALINRLVDEILKPRAPRIPTKPTQGSRERRLEDKKRQARKKEARRFDD